jgi:glycosyltransferase involved in cell wall biosynthesis
MRVTVVTPSYNQARFLPATLASVRDQDHDDIEHIVIDGGSTDGSAEIIRDHAAHLAHWVSERDDGQTDALCRGFEMATGDIHCWLNSDDLFEPWTLREVVSYFTAHPDVDFVFGNSTWIDEDGAVLKPKREHRFSRFVWLNDHNFIPQPSTFWRSSLYQRVGGLDRSFDLAMDADLWIRFADVTTPIHVDRPWSRMRFYAAQKNTALRAESLAEMDRIRSRYREGSGMPASVRRGAARAMRVALKIAAGAYAPAELRLGLGGLVKRRSWEQATLDLGGRDPSSGSHDVD